MTRGDAHVIAQLKKYASGNLDPNVPFDMKVKLSENPAL